MLEEVGDTFELGPEDAALIIRQLPGGMVVDVAMPMVEDDEADAPLPAVVATSLMLLLQHPDFADLLQQVRQRARQYMKSLPLKE
jgi:hypothetical protein